MDAPLSRFLTRFQQPDAAVLFAAPALDEVTPEPEVDLVEARVAAAREEERLVAEARHADLLEQRAAQDDVRLAAERAGWAAQEGAAHAAAIDAGFTGLATQLSTSIAKALRPLLSEAVGARALAALQGALDHLLTDPDHAPVVVSGPSDLIDAIRARRSNDAGAVDYVVADTVEVSITTVGTHVETRLAAALAALEEI